MSDYETIFSIFKEGKFPVPLYSAFVGEERHCGKEIVIQPQTCDEKVHLEFDEDGNFVGFS